VAGNRRAPKIADFEEEFMANLEAHYSARDIEARILAALRTAGLNPEQRLSPEALAALDHFHTGGLRASRELLEVAQIRREDRVLWRSSTISDKRPRTRAAALRRVRCGWSEACSGCHE
jgi:hypothetical protein